MEQIHITGPNDITDVMWRNEPVFDFEDENSALMTLSVLGRELKSVREYERHIMRHLAAAVRSARHGTRQGGPVLPQTIIKHTGVARQTIYNILKSGKVEGGYQEVNEAIVRANASVAQMAAALKAQSQAGND